MSFKNAFTAAAVTRQHILKQFIMFIMCVWGLGVEGEEEGGLKLSLRWGGRKGGGGGRSPNTIITWGGGGGSGSGEGAKTVITWRGRGGG